MPLHTFGATLVLLCLCEPGFVWLRSQKTASTSLMHGLLSLVEQRNWRSTNAHTQTRCNLTQADYHPHLSQHVAWRRCAFSALRRPAYAIMVFRHPWHRLVSAFCHNNGAGIHYGVADRYAKINSQCANNQHLSDYLRRCPHATDNMYLQHLDPITANVTLAKLRLRRTNVGLSNNMSRTFEFLTQLFGAPLPAPQWRNRRQTHGCLSKVDIGHNHPLVRLAIKDDMELYKIALKEAYKPKPPIWIMDNYSSPKQPFK
jgi:hypothetical protein